MSRAPGASAGRIGFLSAFAQALLVGVAVFVVLPTVVGVLPMLAAGIAHLRASRSGLPDGLLDLARAWWTALRRLWLLGLALPVLCVVVLVDLAALRQGTVPGGAVAGWLSLAVATAGLLCVLRAAGAWSDPEGRITGMTAGDALRAGVARSRDDLTGCVLLLGACAVVLVLVWMLAPLLTIVGGLLAIAIDGTESRRARAVDAKATGSPDVTGRTALPGPG